MKKKKKRKIRISKKDLRRLKKYSTFGLSFLVIGVVVAIALLDEKKNS